MAASKKIKDMTVDELNERKKVFLEKVQTNEKEIEEIRKKLADANARKASALEEIEKIDKEISFKQQNMFREIAGESFEDFMLAIQEKNAEEIVKIANIIAEKEKLRTK